MEGNAGVDGTGTLLNLDLHHERPIFKTIACPFSGFGACLPSRVFATVCLIDRYGGELVSVSLESALFFLPFDDAAALTALPCLFATALTHWPIPCWPALNAALHLATEAVTSAPWPVACP
jgi:hypothetical protein